MNTSVKKLQYFILAVMFGVAVVLLWPSALAGVLPAATSTTTETYTYDSAGRLTSVTYSSGYTVSYSYDNNGNILSVQVSREEQIFSDGFEP